MESKSGKPNYLKLLFYFIAIFLIYLPLFKDLGTLPIRLWDESRLAINAYEMCKDGDLIVTHFEGKPDMWNTKPPLMIWCQAAAMKVFGYNEFAVRIPSAIAAVLTCVMLFVFINRFLGIKLLSWIAVFVLITSRGYVEIHCTRTGDYESLLVLFTTAYFIAYFLFLKTGKNKYLYAFYLTLALAVLTKGVNGLLLLPGLFLFTIYMKKLPEVIRDSNTYIGLLIFLGLTLGYYFLRESLNPGYIAKVFENEWGGRYLEVTDNSPGRKTFYLNLFVNYRYSFYWAFALCGMAIGYYTIDKRISDLMVYCFIVSLSFIGVISFGATKFHWYDSLVYPVFAIAAAYGIFYFFDLLRESKQLHLNLNYNVFPALFLLLIFLWNYPLILKKTYNPLEEDQYLPEQNTYDVSYYLKKRGHLNDGDTLILNTTGYVPYIDFYFNILRDKGAKIKRKNTSELISSDKVLTSDKTTELYIANNFDFQIIDSQFTAKVFKLLRKKQPLN